MSYAIGVVIFVVLLLTSVMLHEAGHFATAKLFGMKASRFFVGFGPTLWSFTRGETEYGVKAIPAGGFVKIEGMTQLEELDSTDSERAFWRQTAPKRTVVLAAGSVVHFVIAIVLVFGYLAIGHTDPVREAADAPIGMVYKCLTSTGACAPGAPVAPAYGVLRNGDVVTAVDGHPVSSPGAFATTLQRSAGQRLTLTVRRDGALRQVQLAPTAVREGGREVGKIGVGIETEFAHVSLGSAVPRTFGVLGDFVTETGSALGTLPHELSQILHNRPTGVTGATSVVGVAEGTGSLVSDPDASTGEKIGDVALLIASLNLFVGIFNLLPLLPLDGGHIGILLFEEARKRVYRLFGRRDPGRVDLLKILPVTYAVFGLVVAVSLLLIYSNIVHPISI